MSWSARFTRRASRRASTTWKSVTRLRRGCIRAATLAPCEVLRRGLAQRLFADHDAEKTGLKLAIMADAGKCDWNEQIVPRAESKLDMIRVAFYAHQVSEAVEMIEHCHELGYETSANLMAVSNITEVEIDTVLAAIAPTHAGMMVHRR